MKKELQDFYFNKTEPNKSCLQAIRSIILEFDDNITETLKYGMPCFCYKKKIFCYLWIDKKTEDHIFFLLKENNLTTLNWKWVPAQK